MAATLDRVFDEIRAIQIEARAGPSKAPTGVADDHLEDAEGLDGTQGSRRAQDRGLLAVAPGAVRRNDHEAGAPEAVGRLDDELPSAELFDKNGELKSEIAALAPVGDRRMSANPHANGGLLMRELVLPDIADYAIKIENPGAQDAEATSVMAEFLRDLVRESEAQRNFRQLGRRERLLASRWFWYG
jgi:xylulose-5-phosphate/fructose-6-phosphate phosphoketolase